MAVRRMCSGIPKELVARLIIEIFSAAVLPVLVYCRTHHSGCIVAVFIGWYCPRRHGLHRSLGQEICTTRSDSTDCESGAQYADDQEGSYGSTPRQTSPIVPTRLLKERCTSSVPSIFLKRDPVASASRQTSCRHSPYRVCCDDSGGGGVSGT